MQKMRKQFENQKWQHGALQFTVFIYGAYIWLAYPSVLGYPQDDTAVWMEQHQVEIIHSDKRVDTGNRDNTQPVMISPDMLSPEEKTAYPAVVLYKTVEMSAYTSRVEETDETPCISADGTNICEYEGCVVASNDYKFGTKIIVDGFGECEVKDRMNSRYTGTGNMDIYFGEDLKGALTFGRRHVKIQITS